jgi:dTDP-4-dehydrorhamnose reductase
MRTLVLGADGLLGSHFMWRYPQATVPVTRHDYDVRDLDALVADLKHYKITCLINCAGITNKHPDSSVMWEINAELPHKIAKICTRLDIRMIQVSTDCVFSGDRGFYTEVDLPDPNTSYGKSKLKGEVTYGRHITIRTSFVGWPDPKGRGLLSWLYHNGSAAIEGYLDHMWNGLTTIAVSDYLNDLITSKRTGLVHLGGEAISKYHLLCGVNEIFGWGKFIKPVLRGKRNTCLRSVTPLPRIPGTKYQREMLGELYKCQKRMELP